MKGKRLLKALGQVDADYIEEASPTQQTKRPGWLKWGAIAACLVLVCAAIAHFSPANQDEDKQGVADAAPMVYVIRFTFNPATKKAIQNRKMALFISERF